MTDYTGELNNIKGGITVFKEVVELITSLVGRDKRKYLDALEAINLAATKTNAYLVAIREGNQESDSEVEMELSAHWYEAMRAIQPVDPELAEKCLIKGQCWSNPQLFSSPEFKDIPLSIDYMFKETRRILKEMPSKKKWFKQ